MVMVMIASTLLLGIYAVGYRHVAAAVRIETKRIHQTRRDEGSMHAAAIALTLLETGLPPTDPFVGEVSLDTSVGTRSFTVTFTSTGGNTWSVQVVPTTGSPPPAMPTTFSE